MLQPMQILENSLFISWDFQSLTIRREVTVQPDRQNRVCIAAEIAEEHNSYQEVITFDSVLKKVLS